LVDEQLSTYQMTKRINETGWRTRKGNPHWSAGYIRNLLGNSVYRGIYYTYCIYRRNLRGGIHLRVR
jgi:hypothetical protein